MTCIVFAISPALSCSTPGYCWSNNKCSPCSACIPGQFLNSNSCRNCTTGYYSTINNASFCLPCPAGSTSNSDNTGCAICSPGQYNPLEGWRCGTYLHFIFLVDCPAGQYSSTSGSTSCIACSSGTAAKSGSTSCTSNCGDGYLNSTSEFCDDKNTANSDGCSSICMVETGYFCDIAGCISLSKLGCQNGILNTISEQCDDGNASNNDGCDSYCKIENGWECTGTSPSNCSTICGDGKIIGRKEKCDDGNTINRDGCSNSCTIENGWSCVIATQGYSECSSTCNDGIKTNVEECDDGNTNNSDGCNSSCIIEEGWTCSLNSNNLSICSPYCGDGSRIQNEQCDDGNLASGDGCSSSCQIESGYTCSHASGGKDTCTKQSFMDEQQVQSLQSTTQAAMGVGLATSFLNISAPQGMYSMLGIFRMMIILPFIGAQMSKDVITYLTGLNFVMCSFSFVPVNKVPVLKSVIEYFDNAQDNSMLSDFKMKSSSTFVNHFNVMLIVLTVLIVHLLCLLIYSLTKKCVRAVRSNMFASVYVRVCIELSISVYLNGFIELYQMNLSSTNRNVSFCITATAVCLLVVLNAVGLYKWIKVVLNQKTGTQFEEFFKGFKLTDASYLYTVFIMARRMLSIMIVTVCVSLPMYLKIVMFIVVQLVAWTYIVIIRPFSAVK